MSNHVTWTSGLTNNNPEDDFRNVKTRFLYRFDGLKEK